MSTRRCNSSFTTDFRRASLHKNDNNVLTDLGYEDLIEGRIITTKKLSSYAKDLSRSIVKLQKCKRNIMALIISRPIIKKYNAVLGIQDGISLFKDGGERPQEVRRQMAGSSFRNLMSQIVALLVSHFINTNYDIPKYFPDGCVISRKK